MRVRAHNPGREQTTIDRAAAMVQGHGFETRCEFTGSPQHVSTSRLRRSWTSRRSRFAIKMKLVPASHARGAMKKTWFLTCALWFLSTCASAVEPSEVDHRTWSVDKAEAAQRQGWQKPLSATRAKSSASSWQDQQAAITALTGIGGIPHAPRDEPTSAQRDAQSRFYFGLQQAAEIRAREKGISGPAA